MNSNASPTPNQSVVHPRPNPSRQPVRRLRRNIQNLIHELPVLINCLHIKIPECHNQHGLHLKHCQSLPETSARALLERPPRILGHEVRVRGVCD